jgi:hypothetical protein
MPRSKPPSRRPWAQLVVVPPCLLSVWVFHGPFVDADAVDDDRWLPAVLVAAQYLDLGVVGEGVVLSDVLENSPRSSGPGRRG